MASPLIERVTVSAYRIPTDEPEADGTLEWSETGLVVVTVEGAGKSGFGYTYASSAAAVIVRDILAENVIGQPVYDIPALWVRMVRAVRNAGWRGVCACAISAVDVALWDLKARVMEQPLAALLGCERDAVPIYGSGGFLTYSVERLQSQLAWWVEIEGCSAVKIKIGRSHRDSLQRMRFARDAIGQAELFIDANGALDRKSAAAIADVAVNFGVRWFEEPVSSDDLSGLRTLRNTVPSMIEIAAGEYGYDPFYFRTMLESGAVDVLQADATRCGGISGFLRAAILAEAHATPLSAHTAPSLHLAVCCAAPRVRNIEWFHDHVRIERLLFDGAPVPERGLLRPDFSRSGHGLAFKHADAERFAA